MAETELKVILKAKDLCEHTLRMTSNCNRYPKKYRFSLVDMTWEEYYSQLPDEQKEVIDLAIDYGLTDGLDEMFKTASANITEQEEQQNEKI